MQRFFILTLFLLLFSLNFEGQRVPSQLSGANKSCAQILFEISEVDDWYVLKGFPPRVYGYKVEFDAHYFYADHKRILRLSDGEMGSDFSYELAQKYPSAKVISSDYGFADEIEGNFARAFSDNTKPLPFPDDSFDLVVFRRGLCTCEDACHTCGGFELNDKETIKGFIKEVVRIMDFSKPNAKAFLHGAYYEDYEYALRVYREVRHELKDQLKAELLFLKHDNEYQNRFAGFLIQAKAD